MRIKPKNHLAKAMALAIVSVFFTSCLDDLETDNFDDLTVRPDFALPVASVKLKLDNLVDFNDTSQSFQTNPDNSIAIVYSEDSLFSFDVAEFLEIPQQSPINESFRVGALSIGDFSSGQQIVLSDLVDNVSPSTVGANIRAAQGTNAPFPPIANQPAGTYDFGSLGTFGNATFSNGSLSMKLVNEFPAPLNPITVDFIDNISTNTVLSFVFPSIPAGDSSTATQSLVDVTLTDDMAIALSQFGSPGAGDITMPSTWVPIDTNDFLSFTIEGTGLEVASGVTELPAQNFVSESTTFQFDTAGGQQLTKIKFGGGSLDYNITSTFSEPIQLQMNFPATDQGGSPLAINILVPANGNTNNSIDVSNTEFDLATDMSQAFNIIPVDYSIDLANATTNQISFDSANSIDVSFQLNGLTFEQVEGYFGQQQIDIPQDSLDVNLADLEGIAGTLTLENPKIKFNIDNSVGIPVAFSLNLESINQGTTNAININHALAYPTLAQAGTVVQDSIIVDAVTYPNIGQVFTLPNDAFTYSGSAEMNPGPQTGFDNFIRFDSKVNVGFEMDVPLEISVTNLRLDDTTEVDLGFEADELDKVALKLDVSNGYPFDGELELILLDSADTPLDTITKTIMTAAPVDIDGKVTGPSQSNVRIDLADDEIVNLTQTKNIIFSVLLNTTNGGNTTVKLFTDYEMNINLGVEAKFAIISPDK